MTKLDKYIEKIKSEPENNETVMGLLKQLEEARSSMQDPQDEDEAEKILADVVEKHLKATLKELLGEDLDENIDKEYMANTTAAVEEAFYSQGWKSFTKRSRRDDLMQYELGFNIDNKTIRIGVFVEDFPKRIRVRATLPFVGDDIYSYLVSKAISDANKRFVYGAFKYDPDDGEITYEYSYPVTHGFYQDDFIRTIRTVISSSVDDESFPLIKKAAQGRYKRAERADILKTLEPLIEDLTTD